jgi:hypothetical protein
MDRRAFLSGTLALVTAPCAAEAQQAGKVPRVGILLLSDSAQSVADAFRQGLRELGYVEGQTIALVPGPSSFCWTRHSAAPPYENESQSSRQGTACRRCTR